MSQAFSYLLTLIPMHDLPTTTNVTHSDAANRRRDYAAFVWTISERLRNSEGIRNLDGLERYLYDLDRKVDPARSSKKTPMP
jgi:hypothetical protein